MAQDSKEDLQRAVEKWHLDDADAAHKRNPDSFRVPSLEERRSLVVGRRVRLHFMFDKPAPDGCQAERMWVTITERNGDKFKGELENEPLYIRNLSVGDSIAFNLSQIAQILIPKTDPRWLDVSKKAVVSKRVFETKRVSFLYREKPRNDEDSGWSIWAGGEDEAFNQNSTNFSLVTLERLLGVDESLESLLTAEVGSVFERPTGSKDFQRVHDWKPTE